MPWSRNPSALGEEAGGPCPDPKHPKWPDAAMQFFLQGLGGGIQDIAYEVIPLPGHPLEMLTDGSNQPAVMGGDDHIDSV